MELSILAAGQGLVTTARVSTPLLQAWHGAHVSYKGRGRWSIDGRLFGLFLGVMGL